MEILWFLLTILAIGIGAIIVVVLMIYAVASALSPSSPNSQIKEFSSNMLGYEFTDGSYEVMESKSKKQSSR